MNGFGCINVHSDDYCSYSRRLSIELKLLTGFLDIVTMHMEQNSFLNPIDCSQRENQRLVFQHAVHVQTCETNNIKPLTKRSLNDFIT